MRGRWRAVALIGVVALAGVVGTMIAAAAVGMPGHDLQALAWMLLSALCATTVAVAVARPLLAHATLRTRLVAVSVIGVVVAIANLAVLARLMFVSQHDLTFVSVTLLYAVAAGVASALVIARTSASSFERIVSTAQRLGDGDLEARVGELTGGPELETLGKTLDLMAGRLQAAVDRERRTEATRRDLFTAVSHDLRTPLASLRAMIEAMDDGVVDDAPSMHRYFGEMRTSAQVLSTLVDDLFELAQLDAGAIERETGRVRLEDALANALEACRPEAFAKGLTVESDLATAANALCSPRLSRVLQNLLTNAIRHTPADGTVRIEASRSGNVIEVAVEDSGPGIAAADAELVFEPFWRADPARAGAGTGVGAGLGLTLARRIAEAIGGSLEVQPGRAEGARFALLVPER